MLGIGRHQRRITKTTETEAPLDLANPASWGARVRKADKSSLSPFERTLARIAQTGTIEGLERKSRPASVEKDGGARKSAVGKGRIAAGRVVGEATAELIERVTRKAVDETLDRVNEVLGGLLKKAEAEAEKSEPTWQEKHEAEVAFRRAELLAIDLLVASGKSGMLELALPEEPTKQRFSKADAEANDRLARTQIGLRPNRDPSRYT